jgi:hypothetical protein
MSILYRALRKEEIDKGNILLPKSDELFVAPNIFPQVFPIIFGDTPEHAARIHQWDGKIPTRGISTTPIKDIAFKKYGQNLGVIAIIDRVNLKRFGITEYKVSEVVPEGVIFAPEDEEVILVYEKDDPFPSEIIIEVVELKSFDP